MITRSLVIMLLLLLLHYLIEELASLFQAVSPLDIRLLDLLAQRLWIQSKRLVRKLIVNKSETCIFSTTH
jgi:hypothetical protein